MVSVLLAHVIPRHGPIGQNEMRLPWATHPDEVLASDNLPRGETGWFQNKNDKVGAWCCNALHYVKVCNR